MAIQEERFWARVEKTPDCWLWTGTVSRDGYGHYGLEYGRRAHRIAYILTYGEVPPGFHVLHHCDTPLCVRPEHLYLGTHQDNMRDRDVRNRTARGERSYLKHHGHRNTPGEGTLTAKLTAVQVAEIRQLYQPNPHRTSGGLTQRAIAERFGVKQQTISKVLTGQRWGPGAHVPEPPVLVGNAVSDEQVTEIRERYAAGGVSQQHLADEFGTSQSHVSRIVRGELR